jgi:hypothetical protein
MLAPRVSAGYQACKIPSTRGATHAPLPEVVHVWQQVPKSLHRVHKSEQREQEPQDSRQEFHVGLFRAPTANLNSFPGLDFLEGQDQCRKMLAQVFEAIGG